MVSGSLTFIVNALQPAEVMKVVLDETRPASTLLFRTISCRWPSAGAAETCASPRSSPAGTSTS